MQAAVRPWVTTGIAFVGASVIAVTPLTPPITTAPQASVQQVHIREVHLPDVQLSASIVEIFTFPAIRQFIVNRVDDIATLSIGLAGSAAGLGQAIGLIPETLRTITQQVLSGDLLGALTTIEVALVGSIVAVGGPTLAAIIERRQRYLAVREALQVAVPEAIVSVVGGLGRGIDEVARAIIIAGQGLVDAVLTLGPGDIAAALVNGTKLIVGSFVDGGQHVVDGIVAAQDALATALAAEPAAAATAFSATAFSPDVTDVGKLSRKTVMLAVAPPTERPDTEISTDTSGVTTTESDGDATEATTSNAESVKPDPKPDSEADEGQQESAVKDDHPVAKSPKRAKHDAAPQKETKKADNESEAEGAKQK